MKKIIRDGKVVGVQDESGAFLPPHMIPKETAKRGPKDPPKADINLDNLLDSYMLILFRETRSLLVATSKGGKLTKDDAQSMRDNMKLVMELKKKERELLDSLTDTDIQRLIEEKLNESDKSAG